MLTYTEKDLIKYFKSLGLEVNTATKARGHQGFFLNNRIDISKNIPENRIIPTLIHEFAHYIHSKIEKNINKTGGTLESLFKSDNPIFLHELIKVTNFVDEHSLCLKLIKHKELIKEQIKIQEKIIKADYPKFMRSKKFKEFDKYIKKSKAKYLLKYDRVQIVTGFWGKKEIFSIDSMERDFFDIPRAFAAYIRLKSYQRKQARNSNRINRLKKYYSKPTELFARFVEGLYINADTVQNLAPLTSTRFFELLDCGYYMELDFVVRNFIE